MKKKLLTLPDEVLFKIGRDFGFRGTREEVASALTVYFGAYSLTWQDVKSRYNLA